MLVIPCPYCGDREETEFSYGGESHIARPEGTARCSGGAACWPSVLRTRAASRSGTPRPSGSWPSSPIPSEASACPAAAHTAGTRPPCWKAELGLANGTRALCWTAAAFASQAWVAPTQDPTFKALTTPDGTRFLLVPDSDPARSPVVHWVHLTPAGYREDPIGLEGLTQATARASLNGTIDLGSLNWRLEEPLLRRLDDIERRIAALEARGEPRDQLLEQAASEVRKELGKVADRFAWQRAIRRAPSIEVHISETDEASLLVVTTTPAALVRVAGLILARREAAQLRGLRPLFRQVRAELARQSAGTRAAMRREVLGLAYLGDVLGRPLREHPAPFTRSQALDLYRATQHPTRTYHVLTGGFDLEQVARILEKIFVETRIERPPAQQPLVEQGSRQRLSVIPSASLEALSIGYQVSSSAEPEHLAILAECRRGLRRHDGRGERTYRQ